MNIDNKNQSKFLVDVNSLRAKYPRKELNPVRDGLRECGCTVTLEDRDNRRVMKICGNITESKVVSMFNKICEINVEPYFVTPGDWTNKYNSVNEKKKPCCPPKKKVNEDADDKDKSREYLSLKECLNGKKQPKSNAVNSDEAVNRVIDIMSGKKLNESIADMAINKITEESKKFNNKRKKFSNKVEKIIENMDPDVFLKVVENLEANAKTMYSNVVINKKKLSEYSCAELEAMVQKVNEQIETLAKKVSTMNEAEGLREHQIKLDEKKRLQKILEYEITYRKAYEAKVNEGDGDDTNLAGIEFKDLNPGAEENQDKKDDEKSDDAEKADKDDKSDDADDEEQNPDEDEVEELSKIIITLSNEEAANNLRDDLVEAGIPEDVIEVAPADEADEDDEDESSDEGSDATGFEEETDDELDDIFNNADNKAEESAKPKDSKNEEAEAINEDDDADAEPADGGEADGEASADVPEDGSEATDEGDDTDKQYNLILTDTDYVETFKKVLIDLWGVTEDEFVEMVGEIVTEDDDDEADGDADEKSDEDDKPEDKDGDKEESDKDDNADDGLDFDPEEIFKGM